MENALLDNEKLPLNSFEIPEPSPMLCLMKAVVTFFGIVQIIGTVYCLHGILFKFKGFSSSLSWEVLFVLSAFSAFNMLFYVWCWLAYDDKTLRKMGVVIFFSKWLPLINFGLYFLTFRALICYR